jgi:muramoyltetrapeptide carboxypeptidase LdcA involved in peptidoglycan recycling
MDVIEFLKSTTYYLTLDSWKGKILLFETSEDKPSPSQVGYMLRNYEVWGVFNKINVIMFGRPIDYSEQEIAELKEIIVNILNIVFKNPHIQVFYGKDYVCYVK